MYLREENSKHKGSEVGTCLLSSNRSKAGGMAEEDIGRSRKGQRYQGPD